MILIVEDEAIIRELLVFEFEDADFVVHEAGSADDALELLADIAVEAVVTDLRMPGAVDGTGLVTWLRQHRADVPVVVTSGHAAVAGLGAPDATGVPIVAKPYRPTDVVALVAALLERTARPLSAEGMLSCDEPGG